VLESGVGGRIYERTAHGVEHDWGVVTVWDPPTRLAYLWHLGRDRSEATDVDIRFVARGPDDTRLEIEHRGWERLGATADTWRDRNRIGWETLLPHFAADEKKPAAEGTVEAWGRSPDNPVDGWYGLRNGYRGRFGMYVPPLLEELGLAELTHDARNNHIRAIR
jgi:hypothetical protein